MKKIVLVMSILAALFFLTVLVSAEACNLQISLLNQDPYPAVPGDYVKLVFQVTGAENPECGSMRFNLVNQYPISFDANTSSEIQYTGGTFVRDYSSSLLLPYKVRVDGDAIDGDNPIKLAYSFSYITSSSTKSNLEKQFTLNVQEVRTIFEAYVKNFDAATNILTVQILNSGKSNVDALTIEIPEQENATVKGSNRNIVGSLDANEYTTSDFEVAPMKADIQLNLYYTDQIGVRRQTTAVVHFDPLYFEGRKSQQSGNSTLIWIIGLVVVVVIYILYKRYKKNQKKKLHS